MLLLINGAGMCSLLYEGVEGDESGGAEQAVMAVQSKLLIPPSLHVLEKLPG